MGAPFSFIDALRKECLAESIVITFPGGRVAWNADEPTGESDGDSA